MVSDHYSVPPVLSTTGSQIEHLLPKTMRFRYLMEVRR